MSSTIPTLPITGSDPNLRIPILGFGVGTAWFKRTNPHSFSSETVSALQTALSVGFTHIDGAETYHTEPEIGEALRTTSIPRENIFLVTKVNDNLSDIKKAFGESLKKLGTEYVDLYLLHQPYFRRKSIEEGVGEENFKRVWKEIEEVYESGRAKSIGVSNFEFEDLQILLSFAKHKPSYNQIEFHPQLPPSPELLAYHRKHNIQLASYGPLTSLLPRRQDPSNPVPGVAKLATTIGEKHGKTASQVLLRWVLDQGVVAITTSSKEERLREYLGALGWELTRNEIEEISEAGQREKRRAFWRQIGWLRERDQKAGIA